jgi:hypothetical protein
MALQIETDFGKKTSKIGLKKQTNQAGLLKRTNQAGMGKLINNMQNNKPKSAIAKFLESLSDDRFKNVKKVDTII